MIGLGIALAMIALVEVAARASEPYLPEPDQWPSPEAAAKVDQMEALEEGADEITTVFLGSSVVAEGIDPVAFTESYGETGYNAALSAASPRSLDPWARGVVLPTARPMVAVIGLISRDLNDNGISQTEFLERLESSQGMIERGQPDNPMDSLEKWLLDQSALFRVRPLIGNPQRLFSGVLGNDEGEAEEVESVGPLGQDASFDGQPYANLDMWRAAWNARHLNDFLVGDSEIEALANLIRQLKASGVHTVIVNMPVTDDYIDTIRDGERVQAEFSRLLEDMASDHDVAYLDVSDAFDKEAFRDPGHLTPDGARTLSITLAESALTSPEDATG